MPETTESLTADEIKSKLSFPDLMAHYGYKPDHGHKMLCPFHQEKTGSFHVYDERGKCYGGCGWHGDVIQFVMDKESLYFGKALELMSSWIGHTQPSSTKEVAKTESVPKKVRREPVNPEIVEFFHSQLTPDKRVWLHEKRLLTDETIDYLRIGWRPDMEAYSIPFWKGAPGISEVDIMQFRYAPKEGRKARYIGLDGHGFAGLIGRQTLNPEFLVIFVGTLDCVLANQDGIPAVSPNGLTVWKNRLDELKWIIGDVKQLFFVPDNSTSETIESVRLANALGAKIKYLPQMDGGKDYTDFRQDHTAQQFIEEVLGMSIGPFVENTAHVQTVKDIVEYTAAGESSKALELLDILELTGYAPWAVCHKMMCITFDATETLYTVSEANHMIGEFERSLTYEKLRKAITQLADDMSRMRGNF